MRNIIALLAFNLLSVSALAAGPFEGTWRYFDDERGQAAEVNLVQDGKEVSGTWTDGNAVRVWAGSLKGTVRKGKLYVRFCSDGAFGNESFICPHFEPESAYFRLNGTTLVWYRLTRSGYEEYVVLKGGIKARQANSASQN